jgi:hypothetical protein
MLDMRVFASGSIGLGKNCPAATQQIKLNQLCIPIHARIPLLSLPYLALSGLTMASVTIFLLFWSLTLSIIGIVNLNTL